MGERDLGRVEVRIERADRLPGPDPIDQPGVDLGPVLGRHDVLVAPFERLPHEEPHVLALFEQIEVRGREPFAQRDVVVVVEHRRAGEPLSERLLEQAELRSEVVVEHPLVDVGAVCDLVDTGAGDALLGELVAGGVEDAAAGRLGVTSGHR